MTIQTDSRITSEMLTDGLNNTFPYDFPIFKGDNGQKGVEVRFMNDLGYDIVDPSLFLVIEDSDNTSGMVQFYVPPVAGKRLLISGKTPIDQQLDITNASRFNGKSIETNFDKIVSMIQEFVSSLDEEIRQRINNNDELRNKLDLMFAQYAADVDARFESKWTEIADYLNATLPMFFCIMRKEIDAYATTGLIDVLNNYLENETSLSALIDEYIASLDQDFVINTRYFSGSFGFDPSFIASGGKYPINAKLKLSNGDIVRSTVANNTVNPNIDITGWVKTNDSSQIFDGDKSQKQINSEKISSPIIRVSEVFGTNNYEKMRNAITIANSKLLRVDIDVNVVIPLAFTLSDMLDIFVDVYSSNKSTITYSKFGIPIFLIKKQGVDFGSGLTLIWSGITPTNVTAPQDWGVLRAAMGFNVTYNYSKNTAPAPIVFLGVNGTCRCDFTITNESNLIWNCISSLPPSATGRNSLHLDCVFDGVIFGLNSQNFDGLTGTVKGKRYGNVATTGVPPGHLIYLTNAGSDLPVWSKNINIHADDTEAKCVTEGLFQDDVSIKLMCVEDVVCFVNSNRPHGAFDFSGSNVIYTIISDRNINRVGNEGGIFAFRNQNPAVAHQTKGATYSGRNTGICLFDTLPAAGERGVLVTSNYAQSCKMDFFGKIKANYAVATVAGSNSKLKFNLNYEDPQNIVDSEVAISVTAYNNATALTLEVDTNNPLPKPIRVAQGNTSIGDVTLIDVTNSINSDSLIKRYYNSQKYAHKKRISGSSTAPINITYAFGYGDYEVLLVASSDGKNSIYKSSAIVSISSSGQGIYIVDAVGAVSQKWTLSYSFGVLTATPATTESSNINVSIVKL